MLPPIPNISSSSSAATQSTATGPVFGDLKSIAAGAVEGVQPVWIAAGVAVAAGLLLLLLRKKKKA